MSCKSTDKANNQSKGQAETESQVLSPADLAQLRDTYKLDPDAAIVAGTVVEVKKNSNNDFILEVDKLEKKGFGFSNQLRNGDRIEVIAGRKGGDIKQQQSVLIVISANKRPGASDQYLLEKVLAAMPGK
ncbi:MAG: hypothetical protein HEP71_20845 [Roseivirga sp.]|nr:hypothetical protein [Roseivirga sp.]